MHIGVYFMFLILVVCQPSSASDSFLSNDEYAKMLYENPRGIGCNKCHGKKGEGMVISRYKHKGEDRVLETKEINSMNFDEFSAALENKKSIMTNR